MTRKEEIIAEAKKHEYDWGIDVDRFDVPDIFVKGAEWADRTMVDKACEWIKEIHIEKNIGSLYSGQHSMTFDKDTFIEEFRKAMLEEE